MKIRRRTLRRLTAFVLVLAVGLAIGLWLKGRGDRRHAEHLQAERARGLHLLTMGEHAAALQPLGRYLSDADPERVEADVEARLAYAQARAHVPEPGGRHIEQAARLLRDLLDEFPDDPRRLESLHLLMTVAEQGRDWRELRRLADEALDGYPGDRAALRHRRRAAELLRDLPAALADSLTLNELWPHDVDEHIWTLRLLSRMGRSPEEIVRHAVELVAANPEDPRFLLVLAVAHDNAMQSEQAMICLRQASQAELPPDDPIHFIVRLAGLFDTFGDHASARDVYAAAVARLPADHPALPRVRQLLALRLWQDGRLEEALGVLPAGDGGAVPQPIEYTATRILLQFENGQVAEASHALTRLASLAETLEEPEQRRTALAWQEALAAAYVPDLRPVSDRLVSLHSALARVYGQWDQAAPIPMDEPLALFRKWAGDLSAQLGEDAQAIEAWRQAAHATPGWHVPHLLVAEHCLKRGLFDDAEEAASEARRRSIGENDRAARALLARIAYERWLEAPSAAAIEEAEARTARLQRTDPLNATSLPIHVHLLALTDPASAGELLSEQAAAQVDPELRVALARVSVLAHLGLEEQLLEGVQTADAALLRARILLHRGDAQAAERAVATDNTSRETVPWQLARARFLEQSDPQEAAPLWRRLGDAYPQNLDVQLAVLDEAESARGDREFISRTIDRLSEITGAGGRRWRLERARWLLGESASVAALDAAELLRGLIRETSGADTIGARILLSQALMLGGNLEVAVEHLEAAYELDESRADVGLRLAALYDRTDRRQDARRILANLAAQGARGVRERLELADRLANIGKIQIAISILEQTRATGRLPADGKLVLADLLVRANRTAEAERVYEELVGAPAPPASALLAAAVFHDRQDQRERALRVLERLADAGLSEADRRVAQASYYARIGDVRAAEEMFNLALAEKPASVAPWREAVSYQLSLAQPDAALKLALQAAARGVADERLAALRVEAEAMATANALPAAQLEALAEKLVAEPELARWHPLALPIKRAAAARRAGEPLPASELPQLERAATVFTCFRPLHVTLVESYGAQRLPLDAARVARRLAKRLPHDAAIQQMAFASCRAAEQFAEAEQYAHRWRSLTQAEPLPADLALAESRALQSNFEGALEAISPYLGAEMSEEGDRVRVIAAEAFAALGQPQRAMELLGPGLARNPAWRAVAIRIAAEHTSTIAEAARWQEAVEQAWSSAARTGSMGDAGDDESFPPGIGRERVALAAGWVRIGQRLGDPQALARGREQLTELTAGPLRASPDVWAELARASTLSQDFDAAESAYRRVLTLSPRNAPASNALARLLLHHADARRRTEALAWSRIAVEEDPSNAGYQDTLARSHLVHGETSEAVAAFKCALRLDDTHLSAMLGLSVLLLDLGERETAAGWYQRLQASHAAAPTEVAHLREEFDRLSRVFAQNAREAL